MKVLLQNDDFCRVVTVKDGEIDLYHYDDIWDIHTRAEFNGVRVDVCVTGNKTDGEPICIDYNAPVTVEAFDKESETRLFECCSPIIADEYSTKMVVVSPDELIRQMAQIAVPLMADSSFVRDFAYIDTEYVRSTDAKHPFLWLVREDGTYLYDLTVKLDVSGFITCMDMFGDQCCLFHFDGRYLLPVMPRTVRKMLKRIDNRNKLQDEKNRM